MTPRETITAAIGTYRVAMREKDDEARARLAEHGQNIALFAGVQCIALALASVFGALALYNVPQAAGRAVAAALDGGWLSSSYAAGVGDSIGAAAAWGLLSWLCVKAYRAACHHADVVKGDAT